MSINGFINRSLRHTAVYWGSPSPQADGSNGYSAGVEIRCYWNGSTKVITDSEAKEIIADAMVLVNTPLETQGVLYKGALADLTAGEISDPTSIATAFDILEFDVKESFINSNKVNAAYLRKKNLNG
jgi:hypothetical protein